MTVTPSAQSLGSSLHSLRTKWGWAVALGVVLILCGIIALLSVVEATAVTVIWVGAMMIVAGVVEIVHGVQMKGWGRATLWLIAGALYVIGGVFAVFNPLLASVVLTLILAIALIIAGGVRVVLGFHLRGGGHSGWVILSGAPHPALRPDHPHPLALLQPVCAGHHPGRRSDPVRCRLAASRPLPEAPRPRARVV